MIVWAAFSYRLFGFTASIAWNDSASCGASWRLKRWKEPNDFDLEGRLESLNQVGRFGKMGSQVFGETQKHGLIKGLLTIGFP